MGAAPGPRKTAGHPAEPHAHVNLQRGAEHHARDDTDDDGRLDARRDRLDDVARRLDDRPRDGLPAQPAEVVAVSSQAHYQVGDHPQLLLQVTNSGPSPCVQDLADSQVELRVYNGESRVWGSHDCQIEPGTNLQTLLVGHPVRVSIIWSGLSSQPKCAGTRQRVGAGAYTLYALLSGHTGTAAQFSIS